MMEKTEINNKKDKILGFINESSYVPMNINEISFVMGVPDDQRHILTGLLYELESEGKIAFSKKNKVLTLSKHNIFPGVFSSSQKGFGFVALEDNNANVKEIFIPAQHVNGALHKDKVLCRILSNSSEFDKKDVGEVYKILERGVPVIVGCFEKIGAASFVYPDDKKLPHHIFIPKNKAKGAVSGHKVIIRITESETKDKSSSGEVLEIIGHKNDPGVDILSIVIANEMPHAFPENVLTTAENISTHIKQEEMQDRKDFRNQLVITIDGADSKDLDDAVFLEKTGTGYQLFVHIADVSHYVTENGVIDKEAYKRGTSAYLADRVIPMLPHKLSNGICSLNVGEDRLTLSCFMEIDKNGKLTNYEISTSVINVKYRMTYDDVNEILTNPESVLRKNYSELVPMLKDMQNLAKILREKRIVRGAIEFDFKESKIIVDENGFPVDIVPAVRNTATGIIEEFMILCNETVAQNFEWQGIPFVYRVHEEPDIGKITRLQSFVKQFGYKLKGSKTASKSMQELLGGVENSPFEIIVNRVVLRSMKQARYSAGNIGHYGLASKSYCHFTSPIRRYPDLTIHRIVKAAISGNMDEAKINTLNNYLDETCRHSSYAERIVQTVEREVEAYKKVQYMSDKIGQVFEGVISGLTTWGIYVELENTVEGLISYKNLIDDFYIFDEENWIVKGEKTKKSYRLGEKVIIRVVSANLQLRQLDFEFYKND